MSNRKIVHVSSAHPWTDNRIHYRECETLAKAGYDVTLIAVDSDVVAPADHVRVLRIPRRSRLKRFLISSPQAIFMAIGSGAHVIHLHDPELAWGVPILRALGRTVIFDAHEDLPVDVLNKPYISKRAMPALLAFAHFVVWAAARANHVVAATEAIAERFPAHKTTIVHNYPPLRVAEEAFDGQRSDAAVYIGAMSEVRGTGELLDAATSSGFPAGWRLIIAGTPTAEIAQTVAAHSENTAIENLGQLSPVDARDLLLRGKVGIVPLQDTPAHREALPTKMFEYFAAGLPVVASNFPLWRSIVEENECGILVDPSSPEEIARAIARYADDSSLWRRHSENARKLAIEKLNWEPEGQSLVALYRGLLE